MAVNWQFGSTDSQFVKRYSDNFQLDAIADVFWPALIQTIKGKNVDLIAKSGAARNAVIHYRDLAEGKGKGGSVLVYNAAAINSAPYFGDVGVQGNAAQISTYTQTVSIDQVRQPLQSNGELSEQRMLMDFRETANDLLAQWANGFIDETFTIALVGETTFVNSYTNYTSGGFANIMGTAAQSTDSNHIVYAGNATTNATAANQNQVVTAQLLGKLRIQATQKVAVPLRKLKGPGLRGDLVYLDDANILIQLPYDSFWANAQSRGNDRGSDNPALSQHLGTYQGIDIFQHARAFRPIANVAYGMLLGAGCLHYVPVHNWKWFEGFEDHDNIKVVMVKSMFGVAPAYFNGAKRNMLLVPHYVSI